MAKQKKTDDRPVSLEEIKKAIEEYKAKMPSAEERKSVYQFYQKELQRALYHFTNEHAFVGNLLQEFDFFADETITTAAMCYNVKEKAFCIRANPWFFTQHLKTLEERVAVLHHEVEHFLKKHHLRQAVERTTKNLDAQDRDNISKDLAINQYIQGLPKGCMDIKYFTDKNGVPYEAFQTSEHYYNLLDEDPQAMDKAKAKMKADGIEIPDGEGVPTTDEHRWDDLTDEEKKELAKEMGSMVKRTMEKTQYGKSAVPKEVQDLLEELNTMIQSIDYKWLLANAIKKWASGTDRKPTWNRPNKRYGTVAPGTCVDKFPMLHIYHDTSGSRSHREVNEALRCMDNFLRVGSRNCLFGLWHTALYHKRKYRRGQEIEAKDYQSGGTDLDCVLADINRCKPDLAIVFTDGEYYHKVKTDQPIVFVINNGRDDSHPMKGESNVVTVTLKGINSSD